MHIVRPVVCAGNRGIVFAEYPKKGFQNIMEKFITPSILQGMVELLPKEQILFNKMMDTIRISFESFGFIPVDTPIIEKAEILLAKSGGDTEKQIYRFTKGDNDLTLRFDLTVPLARFVAQHQGEITFPFRRYQIGKAYRGERPQRGRFREFYQFDIDIIGNETLNIANDAEIPSIIYTTFKALGFDNFTIRLNNRKILNGVYEYIGITDKAAKADVMRLVDKADKMGIPALEISLKTLLEELSKQMPLSNIDDITNILTKTITLKGGVGETLNKLKSIGIENDIFQEGVNEMERVVGFIKCFGVPEENYKIDLSIARGLDYYTGTVYETVLNDYPEIGSVCSGGRYDNLAQNFTDKKLPGVGISIGLSRLFYQLTTGNIIKNDGPKTTAEILVIPMEEGLMDYAAEIAAKMRAKGRNTEIFLNSGKFVKKMNYANKIGVPYVIVIGEDEKATGKVFMKNMATGEQEELLV